MHVHVPRMLGTRWQFDLSHEAWGHDSHTSEGKYTTVKFRYTTRIDDLHIMRIQIMHKARITTSIAASLLPSITEYLPPQEPFRLGHEVQPDAVHDAAGTSRESGLPSTASYLDITRFTLC